MAASLVTSVFLTAAEADDVLVATESSSASTAKSMVVIFMISLFNLEPNKVAAGIRECYDFARSSSCLLFSSLPAFLKTCAKCHGNADRSPVSF
jgi:hypothetical protein